MVDNKQKKNVRQRGYTTHGWGSMKKHRGAGSRGGRGNAGSGKKADQKKPSYWKDLNYFGKHYFVRHGVREEIIKTNIVNLEKNIDQFEKQGDVFIIDLAKIGINKLLGTGKVTKKLNVKVKYASQIAIDKIMKAGGKVELTASEQALIKKSKEIAPKEEKTANQE